MAKKYKHSKTTFLRRKPAAEDSPVIVAEIVAKPSPTDLWLHVIALSALTVLCASLYAWTLHFPMVFDDHLYLKNNPLVKDGASFGYLMDLQNFATWPARHGLEPDLATNFILRPVAYATFHLNYVVDEFNPQWWRLFNIVVHLGNAALVYTLIWRLLAQAAMSSLRSGSVYFIALTSALLFVVHPMATESVTYIVQRFTSLGTFFFLLTLVLYFNAFVVSKQVWRWALVAASVVALALGMQTKECAFTAPLIALLIDGLFLRTPWKIAAKRALPLLACMPIIPVLVVLVAWAQNGGVFSWGAAFNITNSKDMPINYWHFLFTQFTVIAEYLRLLVWPVGLNLDPDWPLYRTLFAFPVLLALTFFSALVAGTGWLRQRLHEDARMSLLYVSVLWFLVTVFVSSGLVVLPDLMAEHRAYLPSVGVFVAVACLLDVVRTRARWAMPAIAMVVIGALCIATVQRNEVWRDRISLWEDTAAKSPSKFRVWNNLGVAYGEAARLEEALKCFERAIEAEPQYVTAHMNRTGILNSLGRYQAALDASVHLLKTAPLARQSVDVQCNMGIALIGVGEVEKGESLLREIVSVAPAHRQSHVILGAVYQQQNQLEKALFHWQQAVLISPAEPQLASLIQSTEAQMNLGAGQ